MKKSRASKGLLLPPAASPNISAAKREQWLAAAKSGFVQPSNSNKRIYGALLEAVWPEGHGIPGPVLTEGEIRAAVNAYRASRGDPPYQDVFRRLRELQGEEGFTSIIKEGARYQLQSLTLGPKREPRSKPPASLWKSILEKADFRCAHCGLQEPDVKLSPDHRQPRSRGGTNDAANWQPLCEQCNNLKSSACQGCDLNCFVCSWAFPETYKPIQVDDDNKELIRRESERRGVGQSEFVNEVLRRYFNRT